MKDFHPACIRIDPERDRERRDEKDSAIGFPRFTLRVGIALQQTTNFIGCRGNSASLC